MPDQKAGSWASLDGAEIVNTQRTIAYINNFNLPIKIDADCWCPTLQDILRPCESATGAGPDGAYEFPSTDPAPWYDAAIPESGDFLGFLTTEFEGLGSTFARNRFDTLSGGAILGKLRPQARELRWQGYLFGRTCCAAEYGLRWLTAELAGGVCDDCTDKDLDILLCCPSITGTTPEVTCGTRPPGDPQLDCETGEPLGNPTPPFSQSAATDAFRTFKRAGLLEGPIKNQTREIGCGNCEGGSGCMIEAEFTLIAGNPYMHKEPVCVCDELFPACTGCADPNDADRSFWNKVATKAYPANLEDAALCTGALECTVSADDCVVDPDCPVSELPEIPGFDDPCGCDSIFTTENCCFVSNDIYGQFFEGVPTISVFSGDKPLRNVTIRIYENPQGRTCDDKEMFDVCNLCDELTIRYIPANATLTIDGVSKRVSVECPGDNVQPGESLMASNFRWPVFKCIDYIVKIGADCCERPAASFVTAASNNVNSNTFTGAGTLSLRSATGFPTSGIATIETRTGTSEVKVRIQYTGISGNQLTGITTLDGAAIVINRGDRVTAPAVDLDCSEGVAANARAKLLVTPREM